MKKQNPYILDIELESIYPNFAEGEEIAPVVLLERMLLISSQEQKITGKCIRSKRDVDASKYKLKRAEIRLKDFVDAAIVEVASLESFPKGCGKSRDLMVAFIKASDKYGDEYKKLADRVDFLERELAIAKARHSRYELIFSTIKNCLNSITQVLSWKKHEETNL